MASLNMKFAVGLLLAITTILLSGVVFSPNTMAQSPTPTAVPFPPYDTISIWMYHLSNEGDIKLEGVKPSPVP